MVETKTRPVKVRLHQLTIGRQEYFAATESMRHWDGGSHSVFVAETTVHVPVKAPERKSIEVKPLPVADARTYALGGPHPANQQAPEPKSNVKKIDAAAIYTKLVEVERKMAKNHSDTFIWLSLAFISAGICWIVAVSNCGQ